MRIFKRKKTTDKSSKEKGYACCESIIAKKIVLNVLKQTIPRIKELIDDGDNKTKDDLKKEIITLEKRVESLENILAVRNTTNKEK